MTGSWIVVIAAFFMPSALHAQGGAPQGQFCANYYGTQPEDCSFTTMQMCQASVSGVGGYCAPIALAPTMPPPLIKRDPFALNSGSDPAFAPAAVPPPPMDPAAAPLPLPDWPGNPY
jgi:hypothetical protein